MSDQANMICPACKKFQPKAEECAHCGIVIAKARKPDGPPPQPTKNERSSDGLPVNGERDYLRHAIAVTLCSAAAMPDRV